LIAAANALGYLPPLSPDKHGFFVGATIIIGIIWLSLVAGQPMENVRNASACKKAWRQDFPDILRGAVPASVGFSTESVTFEIPGNKQTIAVRPSVKLVETDAYFLLKSGSTYFPVAKSKVPPQALVYIRNWAQARQILFTPAPQRPARLPPNVAIGLGVPLFLSCLWVGTHVTAWPKPAPYPTTVRLALRDVETIIAGQAVNLQQLSYSAHVRQGALSDELSGSIGRADITVTFTVDRIATPYLAQTAQAEFEEARTWHSWTGQIPADATMEPLPDSGVFIAWDNPPTAAYPGRCAALRANGGTIPVSGGRVLWRYRLRIQACSATMAKADVRDWMLAAIQPLENELALRTQTKPPPE
jgi:hypothetical protein